MQDEERYARKSQYKLLLTLLTVVFLIIAGYTIFWEVRYLIKYNHFQGVEAEVIEHEIDGENTYDVITYSVDGVEYETTTKYQSKNEIGDKIIVYYDTNSPIGVIYSLDYRRYVLPIISILVGGVYLYFLILYKKSYPKTKQRKIRKEVTPVEMLLGKNKSE